MRKIKEKLHQVKDYLYFQARAHAITTCLLEWRNLRQGKQIYESLLKETQKNIFVFPYNSLGDIYIIGLFHLCKCKKFSDPYCLVITGGGCKAVAEMLRIDNVINITEREMRRLSQFAITFHEKLKNIEILHFQYPHTSLSAGISNFNRWHFVTCYEKLVFQEKLDWNYSPEYLNHIMINTEIHPTEKIHKGNTVILSPYAKSMPALPLSFWKELAYRLKEQGFLVFTNCDGNKEKPIEGTEVFLFSLKDAVSVLNQCGYFVGLRSGFCDIISSSECRKVIIYSPSSKEYLSVKKYYSLRKIPGARNFIELTYMAHPDYIQSVIDALRLKEKSYED